MARRPYRSSDCAMLQYMAVVTELILKKLVDIALNRVTENLTRTTARTPITMDEISNAVQHHIRDVKNWSADISFLDLKTPKRIEDAFIHLDVLLQPRRLHLGTSER